MVPRCVFLYPKKYQRLSRLRAEAEQEGAYRVAKRIHAVLLNADGHTSGRIAEILKAPRSKASVWLANYEVYGENGLLEGHRSGRPPELSVVPQCAQSTCANSPGGVSKRRKDLGAVGRIVWRCSHRMLPT